VICILHRKHAFLGIRCSNGSTEFLIGDDGDDAYAMTPEKLQSLYELPEECSRFLANACFPGSAFHYRRTTVVSPLRSRMRYILEQPCN
jgi:hypothetical protein